MAPRQQHRQRFDSSAAQPASARAGTAQDTSTDDTAEHIFSELPHDASELNVAFYNVGINSSQVGTKKWSRTEKTLAADIIKAVDMHALDILCLSELGGIDVGIQNKLREGNVEVWIRNVLAGSQVSPVDIYVDAHYATLVLSDRVKLLEYRLIDEFIETQPYRCFQHFRFHVKDRHEPISIVNCHAPSSVRRHLSMEMRKKYFIAFHSACASDPFIWGGDFNTGLLNLSSFLETIDDRYKVSETSAAQSGSLRYVFSNTLSLVHGDIAVTFGLCSAQEDSLVGKSFNGVSDKHDVVVARVLASPSLQVTQRSEWPLPASLAARPMVAASSSSSSAAQPAPHVRRADGEDHPSPVRRPPRPTRSPPSQELRPPMPTRAVPRPDHERPTREESSGSAPPAEEIPTPAAAETQIFDANTCGPLGKTSVSFDIDNEASGQKQGRVKQLIKQIETAVSAAPAAKNAAPAKEAAAPAAEEASIPLAADVIATPPQPEGKSSSVKDAAQPVRQEFASAALQPPKESLSSAAQPAGQDHAGSALSPPAGDATQVAVSAAPATKNAAPTVDAAAPAADDAPIALAAEIPAAPSATAKRPVLQTESEASTLISTAQLALQEHTGSALSSPARDATPGAVSAAPPPKNAAPAKEAAAPVAPDDPLLKEKQNAVSDSSANSAVQPAERETVVSAMPPHHTRVHAIFSTDDPKKAPLQEALEEITRNFLFNKVAHIVKTSAGFYEMAPVPCVLQKLEAYLEIVEHQRRLHLKTKPWLPENAEFTEDDMKQLHKRWMEDHNTWMDEKNIEIYRNMSLSNDEGQHQNAYQFRRSRFRNFLFKIIGNAQLVLISIQYAICSAGQSAGAIQRFVQAWKKEKESEAYKQRLAISKKKDKIRKDKKKAAYEARQAYMRGKRIHDDIQWNKRRKDELSPNDKKLYEDFKSGWLASVVHHCDTDFGWNKQMRDAASSAAYRITL